MKINEIVQVKEKLSPEGLAAERKRASAEYVSLKKVDTKFANLFRSEFLRLGQESVDQAYQSAATLLNMSQRDAQAIGKAQGAQKEELIRKFVSAIPAGAYERLGTRTTGGGRGKYTHYRDGSERAGQRGRKGYDDSRFGQSTVGKIAKDVGQLLDPRVVGKSKMSDFSAGMDLGDKLGNLLSKPPQAIKRRGG